MYIYLILYKYLQYKNRMYLSLFRLIITLYILLLNYFYLFLNFYLYSTKKRYCITHIKCYVTFQIGSEAVPHNQAH